MSSLVTDSRAPSSAGESRPQDSRFGSTDLRSSRLADDDPVLDQGLLRRHTWLARHLRPRFGAGSADTGLSVLDDADDNRIDLKHAARQMLFAHLIVHTLEQGLFAALTIELIQGQRTGLGANGMLQALLALPLLLLALPLGALADRRSRSKMLLGAEGMRAVVYFGITLYASSVADGMRLALMGVLALGLAAASTMHAVCLPAVAPQLVESRAALLRLNSRMELMKTLGYALGPAVFGVILSRAGLGMAGQVAGTMLIISSYFVFQAMRCVRLMRDAGAQRMLTQMTLMPGERMAGEAPALPKPPPSLRNLIERVRVEAGEGLRFARIQPVLRSVFVAQGWFSLGFACFAVGFVPHLSLDLEMDAKGAGMVASALGVGMFIGAIAAVRLLEAFGPLRVCRWSSLTALLGSGCVLVSHAVHQSWLSAIGAACIGLGPMCWMVATTTMRQVATPTSLQGRVSSVNVLTLGVRFFGALAGAVAGVVGGIGATLGLSTVLMGAFAVVVWRSRALGSASTV